MTKPEKAIAVAKDVLKRLGKLTVKTGDYLSFENTNIPKEGNAQNYINEIESNCRVCALGACLLSQIRLYDKINLDLFESECNDRYIPLEDIRKIFNHLSKIFSKKTICLIEQAFESIGDVCLTDSLSTSDKDIKMAQKYKKYKNDKNRLKAIMKNVIKNKGQFIP